MRNYHIVAGLRKWALQDSNLRPSDYESVSRLSETNTQLHFLSRTSRQIATILDRIRQLGATHSATHFLEVPDLFADSKMAWAVAGRWFGV